MEKEQGVEDDRVLSDEEIKETRVFMLGEGYKINIADQTTLLSLLHLKVYSDTVFQMKWTWAESLKEIDFITSDSPTVQDLEPKFENPMIGPGPRNKHIIVSLPLSPNLCWIGTWNKDMPNHLTIPKLYVKTLNRFRAFYSEQYLYASNYQSALSRLAKKYHGAGLKLSMSGSGSESGSVDIGQFKSKSAGFVPPKSA